MDALIQLLIIAAIFAAGWWYAIWSARDRYKIGTITGQRGARYTYMIGDKLLYSHTPGTFSGIDIVLPKRLPHIFLDGKVREGMRGPRHFIRSGQTIHLEGDFDTYFTCYVPKGYQVLALSILTPDVMQTLRAQVPDCDVEFYMERVRIIVRHRVHGSADATAKLMEAAERLMVEVDHKLASWTDANSSEALRAVLSIEDNPTIRIFGARLRLTTVVLGPIYGLFGLMIWAYMLLLSMNVPSHITLYWIIRTFGIAFLIFPVSWFLLIWGLPRDWVWRVLKKMQKRG